MKSFTLVTVLLMLTLVLASCKDREAEKTGPPKTVDEHTLSMLRQHQAMLDIQKAWDAAKLGVTEGNTDAALRAASELQALAKTLDGFMLHKSADRRSDFNEMAGSFQAQVGSFKDAAGQKDTGKLKALIPEIDAACEGCHKIFR